MRFYFDFISPYAYLGWTQIHDLAARRGREVEPVPVLFAALLDHHGHKGPAEIEPKRRYIFKNVLRLAVDLQVPVAAPAAHPFNPLRALRVASVPMESDPRRALIDRLYAAVWARGEAVTEPAVVEALVNEVGLDGPALIAAATSPEGKARVREQTEAAIAAGVFGVPTVIVDDELFWGVDAFPHLDRFLRGDDPVPPDAQRAWARVRPQAQRKAVSST